MIGLCSNCGTLYETTTEAADEPSWCNPRARWCAPCHWSVPIKPMPDGPASRRSMWENPTYRRLAPFISTLVRERETPP
jgi:hypothetical protein